MKKMNINEELEKMRRLAGLISENETREYKFKVKHDNGTFTIKTTASSEEAALKKLMNAEGAPANAFTLVKPVQKSRQSDVNDYLGKFIN